MRGTSSIRGVGRRVTLLVAWLAFAALLPVLVPRPVEARAAARADFTCGNTTIPLPSLDGWTGASFGGGSALNFVLPTNGGSSVFTTVTGAAPKAAASTSGGTIALGVGAFVASFVGTCKAAEWLLGDGARPLPAFSAPTGVTLSDVVPCSELGVPPPSSPNYWCQQVSWESVSNTVKGMASNGPSTDAGPYNGVTLPVAVCDSGVSCRADYPQASSSSVWPDRSVLFTGRTISHYRRLDDGAWCQAWPSGTPTTPCNQPFPLTNGSVVVLVNCPGYTPGVTEVADTIGGMCGVPPGVLGALVDGYQTCDSPGVGCPQMRLIWSPFPGIRQRGWDRRLRAEVNCMQVTTTITHRAVEWTDKYSDRYLDKRLPMPECPAGYFMTRYRVWRVTTNTPMDIWGAACGSRCGSEWSLGESATQSHPVDASPYNRLIWDQQAPSAWLSPATRPGWVVCLSAGANCGSPEMVEGTCVWGGLSVPEDFCTGEQLDPEHEHYPKTDRITVPRTGVTPGEDQLASTDPALDGGVNPDPDADAEPNPEPGTNPLDPDGDGRIDTEAGAPGNAGDIPGGEGGDCWPNGWGWFNPAEWVLKPIKCAFEWAFVPDGEFVADWWDERLTSCSSEPPCSYAVSVSDFVSESSIVFVDWSDGGPECIDVAGEQVCPRTWDTGAGVAWVPGWVSTAVVVLFWTLLIVAIVKFF